MVFAIIDLEGKKLLPEEHELLNHPGVAGIILFSRNYENRDQLHSLIVSVKKINPFLFVSVDQEGGRIQRFQKGFTNLSAMRYFGQIYQYNPLSARKQLKNNFGALTHQLKEVGIDVNLMPVLDIDHGKCQVIADRSFSKDPHIVEDLGDLIINILHQNKMPAVAKHFPGHGGVMEDSHHTLPVDRREKKAILDDLLPFKNLIQKLDAVMSAHITYPVFDSKPATFSRYWLQEVLRKDLDFKGVVISDDLTMAGAAAMGDYPNRAIQALQAGCDLLTVCNNRKGALAVLNALADYKNDESQKRIKRFISLFSSRFDRLLSFCSFRSEKNRGAKRKI